MRTRSPRVCARYIRGPRRAGIDIDDVGGFEQDSRAIPCTTRACGVCAKFAVARAASSWPSRGCWLIRAAPRKNEVARVKAAVSYSGTDGSNPVPSSGESTANPTSSPWLELASNGGPLAILVRDPKTKKVVGGLLGRTYR